MRNCIFNNFLCSWFKSQSIMWRYNFFITRLKWNAPQTIGITSRRRWYRAFPSSNKIVSSSWTTISVATCLSQMFYQSIVWVSRCKFLNSFLNSKMAHLLNTKSNMAMMKLNYWNSKYIFNLWQTFKSYFRCMWASIVRRKILKIGLT